MAAYNISVIQGIPMSLGLTINDDNGSPLNLSGYSLSGTAKYRYGSGSLFSFTPTISDATGGNVSILVSGSLTAAYPVGDFYYDVFLVTTTGNISVLQGLIKVSPSVYGTQ